MPFDGEIIANYAHYHTGGIAMPSALGNTTVCHNVPTYSKWIGGEQLSQISDCRVGHSVGVSGTPFQAVPFRKGDRYDVGMVYQQDGKPHFGVMGFSVLFVHRTTKDTIGSRTRAGGGVAENRLAQHVALPCTLCQVAAEITNRTSLPISNVQAVMATLCATLQDDSLRSICTASLAALDTKAAKCADTCATHTNILV